QQQAPQGLKAHQSNNTEAVPPRGHRRSVSKMGDNEPQTSPTDYLRRVTRTVRVAQSVEAVTTDAPFACPLLRQGIGSGSLGQSCVEGSVKGRYLRNSR